jgi:hypothetical protein
MMERFGKEPLYAMLYDQRCYLLDTSFLNLTDRRTHD